VNSFYSPEFGHEVVLCEMQDQSGRWQRVEVLEQQIGQDFALTNPHGLYRVKIGIPERGTICRHFQVKNRVLIRLH
jgi:hypothetical protein